MKRSSLNAIGVIGLLAGTFCLFKWSDQKRPEDLARPLETIDQNINGWAMDSIQPLAPDVLQVLMPTSYLSRDYRKNSQHLGLFVAYYAQQRAGEAMHSPKNCLPGAGWEIWRHELVNIPSDGRSFAINKYFVQNAGKRLIVFYWYQLKDRIIADEYLGKFFLIRDAVVERSTSGAFVRIVVPDDPEIAQQATLFSASVIPQLESCLGRRGSVVLNLMSSS